MTRLVIPLLILAALAGSIYGAHAIGLGEGNRFGRLGAMGKKGAGGGGGSSCASTGIYDLSNVCNDVYFIGAMK